MEERVPSLRNQVEQKKHLSFWAFFIIILFFIGVLVLLFLQSPFSKINQIEISGNHLLSKKLIVNKLPFKKGLSYFSVNPKEAEKAISFLSEIKDVDVKREFPNKVYITVQEKKIIGLIRSNYQLYPVFEDGLILKKTYFNLDMHEKPILEGDLSDRTLQLAAYNLSLLSHNLTKEIDRIKAVENKVDEIQVVTKRKHHIFVRACELREKMKVYPSFFKHPPGSLYLLESIWFKPEKYS